jgi:anti-anti-sigma regulatory factor
VPSRHGAFTRDCDSRRSEQRGIFRAAGIFPHRITAVVGSSNLTTMVRLPNWVPRSVATVAAGYDRPPVVILRLRNMTAVDGTGLSAIEELAEDLRRRGRTLVLCGAPAQPSSATRRAEFHRSLGEENICASVQAALDRATAIVTARNAPAVASGFVDRD